MKNLNNSCPASLGDPCSCSCVLCCVKLLTRVLCFLPSLFPLLCLLPRFPPCPPIAPSKMLHLSHFFPIRRCYFLSPTSQLCSCWITTDCLVTSNIKLQSHLSYMCCHGCSLFSLHVSNISFAICPSPFVIAGSLVLSVSIILGSPFIVNIGVLESPCSTVVLLRTRLPWISWSISSGSSLSPVTDEPVLILWSRQTD